MFTPDAVDPRLTVSELAERTGVVRNTAQARLERHREGVVGPNGRGVELRALGYVVSAIVSRQLRRPEIEEACAALEDNPAVLLVEEVAGSNGDLLVRVASPRPTTAAGGAQPAVDGFWNQANYERRIMLHSAALRAA